MADMSGAFTSTMSLAVQEIINDRQDDVDVITGSELSRKIMIRELMMHAYIKGFFDGEQRKQEIDH